MKRLVVAFVAALCCAAFAEGSDPGAPRDGGRRGGAGMRAAGDPILKAVFGPGAERLGLTDEQKAKLKEVSDMEKAGRECQKKVRDATMRQVELMKAEKVDEAAVMKAIDEVFDLRRDMAKAQARRVIAVKSILTPEQIAKIHEEMKKAPERGGSRGQRRGRGARDEKPDRGAAAEQP